MKNPGLFFRKNKNQIIYIGIGVLVFLAFVLLFCGCGNKGTLKKVTLNEVAHSVFYAPMYVAIEKGYFEDEGIDLKLVNGLGADKTMAAVLSGEADIGFMGSEASVYIYNEGAADYVVNFAQLTRRAGNFIVSRNDETDFKITDLKGKQVLGGRRSGMPEMVFEFVLKKYGIDPEKDLELITNIDFGMTSQAFAGGKGDYTIEFEPAASGLEKEGSGYVVASLGVESGYVPYTAFSAKVSYLEENGDTIRAFVRALKKGMEYVYSHTAKETAETISPQFAESSIEELEGIITRYSEQDTWNETLVFKKESYELLLDILESAGVIDKRPGYEILVDNSYIQ